MALVTAGQCWDIIENHLLSIVEKRNERPIGEVNLIVGLVVSAGRDNDQAFLASDLCRAACDKIGLQSPVVLRIILSTIDLLKAQGPAALKKRLTDGYL